MSDISEEKIQQVTEQMKEDNIKFIRLQFVDINGTVKNIVIPFNEEDTEELFNEGMLFDGSSIEGFVGINESDLVLKPGDLKNLRYAGSFVMYGLLKRNLLSATQEASLKNHWQKLLKGECNTISVLNLSSLL